MVRVLAILGLLACLTARQLPVWSSDVELWSVAVLWNVTAPRPAFNLGLALRKQGRAAEAVEWFVRAVERAAKTPRAGDYRQAVDRQFLALEMTGFDACAIPSARLLCSS